MVPLSWNSGNDLIAHTAVGDVAGLGVEIVWKSEVNPACFVEDNRDLLPARSKG